MFELLDLHLHPMRDRDSEIWDYGRHVVRQQGAKSSDETNAL